MRALKRLADRLRQSSGNRPRADQAEKEQLDEKIAHIG
jgi:hypothetical protein